MPNLKAVEFGFNKFCGPSVLSILTGRNTDECALAISRINGQYSVTGVLLSDLIKAANKLGFDTIGMGLNDISLYRALITLAGKGNAQYIVAVTGHFVCVEVTDGRIFFCDNHTREPIPAASSARLGMRVEAVTKVVKNPNWIEPVKPKPKPIWVLITRWACPVCHAEAMDTKYIMHEPDCKWRGYESNPSDD